MTEINPYIATFHSLELSEASGQPPQEAEAMLTHALAEASRQETDVERAELENLMGLTQLLLGDPKEAEHWFDKSRKSDEELIPAIMNSDFTSVMNGNCQRAI